MKRLIITETNRYELTPVNGERFADVYQRFLDSPDLYFVAGVDREIMVENGGFPRVITEEELDVVMKVEARS